MSNANVVAVLLVILGAGAATEALAQPVRTPIPPFTVDVRGALARFKQDAAVGQALNVPAEALPTRGLGLSAGVHVYLLRMRRLTIGVGGEYLKAGDSRTAQPTQGAPAPPTVDTRLTAVAPQLSLNFGRGEGWSYLSAGLGTARLVSERADAPSGETARTRLLNYGGGARWFNTPHLAFTFDVRFYAISPRETTLSAAGQPRAKFMVLSAGVSFK